MTILALFASIQSLFLCIQVRSNSQTIALQRGWNAREARALRFEIAKIS